MSEVAGPFATSFDYVDLPLETFTLTELERQSKGRLHPDNRGHTIKALKQGTEGYSNASFQWRLLLLLPMPHPSDAVSICLEVHSLGYR